MVKILGYYEQERAENLEAFYLSIGVLCIDARIMAQSSQRLSIMLKGDAWTIYTFGQTGILSRFTLGVEFLDFIDEITIGYPSIATLEEDTLKIVSIGPNETEIIRTYEPNGTGCILTLTHSESGTQAKRHFVMDE